MKGSAKEGLNPQTSQSLVGAGILFGGLAANWCQVFLTGPGAVTPK